MPKTHLDKAICPNCLDHIKKKKVRMWKTKYIVNNSNNGYCRAVYKKAGTVQGKNVKNIGLNTVTTHIKKCNLD